MDEKRLDPDWPMLKRASCRVVRRSGLLGWMASLTTLLVSGTMGLAVTPAEAATLSVRDARFFAKKSMQTRARRTDADGWNVGHCSRITSRKVRCDASIWYTGGASCVMSVQVRLEGSSDVFVKARNVVC